MSLISSWYSIAKIQPSGSLGYSGSTLAGGAAISYFLTGSGILKTSVGGFSTDVFFLDSSYGCEKFSLPKSSSFRSSGMTPRKFFTVPSAYFSF